MIDLLIGLKRAAVKHLLHDDKQTNNEKKTEHQLKTHFQSAGLRLEKKLRGVKLRLPDIVLPYIEIEQHKIDMIYIYIYTIIKSLTRTNLQCVD